jgi:hypothetical protein
VTRTRALLLAAVAALLAACTVERQVLLDDTLLINCEQVWVRGESGDRCDLVEQCARNTPENETCCVDFAYCVMGELAMDTTCDQDCVTCTDDHGCTAGVAVCNGSLCETCEQLDPAGSMECDDCPPGWIYLTRNGCPTCECAPPSECDQNLADGCPQTEPGGPQQCYQGMRSADLACATDDAGCFANACSPPGCAPPVPAGCFTECRTIPECGQCATNNCECDQASGGWICDEICVDGYALALTCSF